MLGWIFQIVLIGSVSLAAIWALIKVSGRVKQPLATKWRVILGVAGVSVLLIGYWWLSYRQHQINPRDTTLPTFSQLAHGFNRTIEFPDEEQENILRVAFGSEPIERTFWEKVRMTWLYQDSVATFGRLFKGLAWGCLISVILGTLMGCYEWLGNFLLPPLSLLAKTPGTAMMAVFFVVVGTGEPMFIAMIGFGILPTLTQSIYLAARDDLKDEQIDKSYTLGADNHEVVGEVVFMKILPKVIDNVRLQIGPAMVFLIAAEMLVGEVGMGYQIRMQQRLVQMNVVYNYLFLLGIAGLAMDRVMIMLRKFLCPWFEIKR